MKPQPAPMQRPQSLTALSGGAVLAGTRTLKDWQLASNLDSRTVRFDRWHDKRVAAFDRSVYSGTGIDGPVVRSCISTEGSSAALSTWHEDLIKMTFSSLPKASEEEVGLDQLEASFAKMRIPIDEATFTRYAADVLPPGADCVNLQEFTAFHRAVWANQPTSVRRYAGDPASTGGDVFTGSTANRRLLRSSSVPSGASLKELRNNEGVLRSAFKRYEHSPGFLERGQIPALFHDVGLDLGVNTDIGMLGSTRLHNYLNAQFASGRNPDKVSIHDVVEMQNGFIASLESDKLARTSKSIMHPNFKPDKLIKQSMEAALVSRPSSAVQREAQLQSKVAMVGEFSRLLQK